MGEKSKNGGGKGNVTVVLKADLHCEGCVAKVLKCIRSYDGVDAAYLGGEQRITVVGNMDPAKLREKVERKTHKKVELISPQSKKDGNGNDNKENAKGKENKDGENAKGKENDSGENEKGKENNGGENAKQEKKKESTGKNKSDEKKSNEKGKQLPVTKAVLKVHLHCEGCIQKIRKAVTKTKGYQEMKIEREKNLVTVTGAMDMTALAQMLKKHLKKDVEILPPKKEAEKKDKSGGEKQKNGNDKGKSGGAGAGKKGEDGGGKDGNEQKEGNRAQLQIGCPNPNPYPYPCVYGEGIVGEQFFYNPYPYGPYHAPQLFSDENPNACTVM